MEMISELRQICQKREFKHDWYAEQVAFRVSIYLTWVLIRLGFSGDMTTFLMLLVGLAAAFVLSLGQPLAVLAGALLLQLFFLLDCCDGEVARYRKKTSLTGLYFDLIIHFLVHPVVFMGLTIGVWKFLNDGSVIAFGFLAAIFVANIDLIEWYAPKIVLYFAIAQGKFASEKQKAVQITGAPEKKGKGLVVRLKELAVKMNFVLHYPFIMNLMTLTALINMFLPRFNLLGRDVSFIWCFIVFYGFALPVYSLLLFAHQVIIKVVDREYALQSRDSL